MGDNRNRYLMKNTIIFTLGNFGSKLISFFLIPLYTNVLTTTEYGVVDLVVTVGTVAVPVLTLNISESVMRFALDKDADKQKITQIGTGVLLIGMLVGLFIFPICRSFDKISQFGKILTNILTALYEPFGFSLLLSFLAMFFYLYAYEPQEAGKGWKNAIVIWYQKFKESAFFRKLFFLAFVTSMILFRTLLNRNLWLNPLSNVMGGWGIWETVNGEQKLTTECIENVIMMVPFTSMVIWTFREKIGNGWKKILWQSGKIAFGFSLMIEMLQLLLRLGTFQLSDIFYNTVGGVLGGLMYYAVMKVRKRL